MPVLRLKTFTAGPSLPVIGPDGVIMVLRLQLRCPVRLPGLLATYDGVIDTGSPYTTCPPGVWSKLRPGVDYEWLPFPDEYRPPVARTAGWEFLFRMARLLTPLTLLNDSVAIDRSGVIVQFADEDPPNQWDTNRPNRIIIGLWGGVFDGGTLRTVVDPATGSVAGWLDF